MQSVLQCFVLEQEKTVEMFNVLYKVQFQALLWAVMHFWEYFEGSSAKP